MSDVISEVKSSVCRTTASPIAAKSSLFSHKDIAITDVDSDGDNPGEDLALFVVDPKYSFALDRSKPESQSKAKQVSKQRSR